jgi:cbb3-type cytochrome oxidase subunit 3
MANFIETLPDGWTIYLWLIIGAMIIVAVIYWIRWGAKNEQFDEDIKYVIFDEKDREKMAPAEYAKSREVINSQIESRNRFLADKAGKKK